MMFGVAQVLDQTGTLTSGDATPGSLVLPSTTDGQLPGDSTIEKQFALPPGGLPSAPGPGSTLDCSTGTCGPLTPSASNKPQPKPADQWFTGISNSAAIGIGVAGFGLILLMGVGGKRGRR